MNLTFWGYLRGHLVSMDFFVQPKYLREPHTAFWPIGQFYAPPAIAPKYSTPHHPTVE